MVATCRLLYGSTFEQIEQKTGVHEKTAQRLMQRAIQRAGNEDFNDILACLGDADRSGRPVRIAEGSLASRLARQAMLKHPADSPLEAVIGKENICIPGKRKPSRSLIERVQHQHIHKEPNGELVGELVRAAQPEKPRLGKQDERKRKEFCDFAIEKIETKGAIFIASDECYHEIRGGTRNKRRRITRVKGSRSEAIAAPQPPIRFTQMHWACLSSEPLIGPQHLWESLTPDERKVKEASLIKESLEKSVQAEKNREQAKIPGTEQWHQLQVIRIP